MSIRKRLTQLEQRQPAQVDHVSKYLGTAPFNTIKAGLDDLEQCD